MGKFPSELYAKYHVMKASRIIVALDYPDAESANQLVNHLDPDLCRLKVGKELFTSAGPAFVESLVGRGYDIFLDLKFHDIPTTVAKACAAASRLGAWMVNVHASGGSEMMEAAREAIDQHSKPPLLIAVTVLTSMNELALQQVGISGSVEGHVLKLASLAKASKLDGVVCSAHEAPILRSHIGHDFCLVTPGIRPENAVKDDQSRIVTPRAALQLGSHYLVIGRPITKAASPLAALQAIALEIDGI